MADKENKPEFVVTDRRLFSTDGELRRDVVEAEERREEREREKTEAQERRNEERAQQQAAEAPPAPAEQQHDDLTATAPSSTEQQASAEAYHQSTKDIDARIEKELRQQGRAHRAEDFEVTFEKFSASLYMTTLMQLGLAAPQGSQPQVDLIGARQTIDTIALLQDKTKGNLTPAEQNMLQNILYELRMAYLEVTNLITNPPPQGAPGGGGKA
jgi:hypothetical protein